MDPILAVLVLYRMSLAESASYTALAKHMQTDTALQARLHLVVMDNSPQSQVLPPDFPGRYLHDGGNPGLARRYNAALAEAQAEGATWLLLLDQDTGVTQAYLQELCELSASLAGDERIVAIVPKLMAGEQIYSPHGPQYRRAMPIPTGDSYGIFGGEVRPFNSGALLRVQALAEIGGFPEAYWLDYLDHATFAALQARGGQVFLMHARLQHDLSSHRADKHRDPANAAWHTNQLAALRRCYQDHGNAAERRRMRVHFLRSALSSLAHGHGAEALRYVRAAVGGQS